MQQQACAVLLLLDSMHGFNWELAELDEAIRRFISGLGSS